MSRYHSAHLDASMTAVGASCAANLSTLRNSWQQAAPSRAARWWHTKHILDADVAYGRLYSLHAIGCYAERES